MQVQRFNNGGFVIHKISGYWSGHCSAWFADDGRLIDAEQITTARQVRPLRHCGPMWSILKAIGAQHATKNP